MNEKDVWKEYIRYWKNRFDDRERLELLWYWEMNHPDIARKMRNSLPEARDMPKHPKLR